MKDTLHIYTRVSSTIQEEEGTSLKTQKEIGIELSNKLGMKYQVHNEGGISSSKDTLENRPVMLNVLRLILLKKQRVRQSRYITTVPSPILSNYKNA